MYQYSISIPYVDCLGSDFDMKQIPVLPVDNLDNLCQLTMINYLSKHVVSLENKSAQSEADCQKTIN